MCSVRSLFDDYECAYCGSASQKRRLVCRLGMHGIRNGVQLGTTAGTRLRQILFDLPDDDIHFACALAEARLFLLLDMFVFGAFMGAGSGELGQTA